jgi:tripartite-type tricarboxylate transporter receptor subunit TctC
MSPALGQSVAVENRPRGGAVLAADLVASSPAEGDTWMHVDNGILVESPPLHARLPHDPDRDFAAVGFIGLFPLHVVVWPDSPWRDVAALRQASQARPPSYGTAAVASPHHPAMEWPERRGGLPAAQLPYRGGPAAMQDLLAGNVDCVVIDTATGTPFIRDGRVRALVALTDSRMRLAPEVPTGRALGVHARTYGWQGMRVPEGAPGPVVARLSAEMMHAMQSEPIAMPAPDLPRPRQDPVNPCMSDWDASGGLLRPAPGRPSRPHDGDAPCPERCNA